MAETPVVKAVADPTAAADSTDTSMDDIHASKAVADSTTAYKSADANMDDNNASQVGYDPITGGQTLIMHPSPPRTLRLKPTQEQNTEVDVLDLDSPDSPLSSARSLSPPPHWAAQDDEEHFDDEATNQEQPEGAVADPSTEVPKRNTTKEAKTKAEKIENGGVPHPSGRCNKCTNTGRDCVVNPAVSGGNTCSECAKYKEKCSHQLRGDGFSLRTIGTKAQQSCNNCAKKIQQGFPTECFRASTTQAKKWGKACSECMIHGTFKTCSFRKKKKARAKKTNTGKAQT